MKFLLSPAKTLDYETDFGTIDHSEPAFLTQSASLIKELKNYSSQDIGKLMSLSEKLSDLNQQRFQTWKKSHKMSSSCRQAILAFKGDVYQGLDVSSWKTSDFKTAQQSLRILSGLYGILKPLDLMYPYRLEMGTKLKTKNADNLYQFWGSKITDYLNEELTNNDTIVNLASNEYFSSVKTADLKAPVLTPVFRDYKNGKYKIIAFYAKKARGMMASWAIKNKIENKNDLSKFSEAGYYFDAKSSNEKEFIFLRDEQ